MCTLRVGCLFAAKVNALLIALGLNGTCLLEVSVLMRLVVRACFWQPGSLPRRMMQQLQALSYYVYFISAYVCCICFMLYVSDALTCRCGA